MKDQGEAVGGSRSRCPINLSVEVLGDRWTLLILRDMIFGGKRHFRELYRSEEGISSNVLAERLPRMVERGLLTRTSDPSHRQKAVYSLTEMAISLVPVFAQLGAWGNRFLPVNEALSIRARLLFEGGPELWEEFMADLRETHLGESGTLPERDPAIPRVAERLQAAYEGVLAREARGG